MINMYLRVLTAALAMIVFTEHGIDMMGVWPIILYICILLT